MSLRLQFAALLAGLAILPMVGGGIVGMFIYKDFAPFAEPLEEYLINVRRIIEHPERVREGQTQLLNTNSLEQLKVVILDVTEGRILQSSGLKNTPFIPGARSDIATVLSYLAQSFPSYDLHSFSDTREGRTYYYLWANPSWLDKIGKLGDVQTLSLLTIIPLGLMLTFALVYTSLIIRSINKKIRLLETATQRIARGDLDSPVSLRGKDKFALLAKAFDAMRVELREERLRRSRFFMSVSHDLKTPLASIAGYADAMLDGFDDSEEKRRNYLSIIKSKALLLGERTRSLIEYARMSTGEYRTLIESHRLAGFFGMAFAGFEEEAQVRGFSITSRINVPAEAELRFDGPLLGRVLENLFHNALQYSGDERWIELELLPSELKALEQPGTQNRYGRPQKLRPQLNLGQIRRGVKSEAASQAQAWVFSISNGGPGIPETELKRVFEPFYRLDPARNEAGNGLGLAFAKSIADLHGWQLSCISKPGVKTSFILTMH